MTNITSITVSPEDRAYLKKMGITMREAMERFVRDLRGKESSYWLGKIQDTEVVLANLKEKYEMAKDLEGQYKAAQEAIDRGEEAPEVDGKKILRPKLDPHLGQRPFNDVELNREARNFLDAYGKDFEERVDWDRTAFSSEQRLIVKKIAYEMIEGGYLKEGV